MCCTFQEWGRPVWECCGRDAMACSPCIWGSMCCNGDGQGSCWPNCLCGTVGAIWTSIFLPLTLYCDIICFPLLLCGACGDHGGPHHWYKYKGCVQTKKCAASMAPNEIQAMVEK